MRKRICLLTGASGLVGTRFIRRYAERYRIIAVHHHREIEYATQDQSFVDPLAPSQPLAGNEHAVRAVRADLSQPAEIERVLREVLDEAGTVDVVINGASVRAPSSLLTRNGIDFGESLLAVNVVAPLRIAATLAETIWRTNIEDNVRANRNLINVSSTAGRYVLDDRGLALYSGASAAINHLTYHLASELWHIGIRANAVLLAPALDGASADAAADLIFACDQSSETGRLISPGGSA
jgi:NAD(P)-dependent dehydrogenase (short-subunit alcohol dehydrogenase family)